MTTTTLRVATSRILAPMAAVATASLMGGDCSDKRRVHCDSRLSSSSKFETSFSSPTHTSITPPPSSQQSTTTILPLSNSNFVADAVEKVLPSVVRIEVHAKAGKDGINQRGSGSGFVVNARDVLPNVISAKHLILTNAHCVLTPHEFEQGDSDEQLAKRVYLEFPDDRILEGTIVAFDTARDVALIEPHVEEDNGDNMSAASLLLNQKDNQCQAQQSTSLSTFVRYGEFVAALGAPLELENTVTVGIVSNPRRRCRHDSSRVYIQTDNSCHVGNSGGPLINMKGQVIGITAKKVADGIAYSIPIQQAVESLRAAYLTRHPVQVVESEEAEQVTHDANAKPTIAQEKSEDQPGNDDSTNPIVDPRVHSLFPYSTAVPVSISQRW